MGDWIADYLDSVGQYPVMARVSPGEITEALPASPPRDPEPMEAILRDFREIILPGVTHWNHPRFHGFFANTGSAPGILAEALTAALNLNAMVWRSSPAATELETVVLDWLRQMLGLPDGFEGHINDTASVGSLVALAAAREAVTGGSVREKGMAQGPRLRLYTSAEAHMSVDKAAFVLGLGQAGIGKIPVDDAFRMRPELLEEAIGRDREAGWTPMAVAATVGTTSTTSIDPVPAIAEICKRERIWLHVDAAYGGALAVVPELRTVMEGCDRADSVIVNPHKWLFTPMDCSALFTTRPEDIRRAFSLVPPYLMTPEDQVARNLMDYGPSLGRRFRALKLWMVIRTYGVEGIAARLRRHVELARMFAGWIEDAPDWELMAPMVMGTILFRHAPKGKTPGGPQELDRHNEKILDAINSSGQAFLTHSLVHDRLALRLSIGNIRTTEEDMTQTWDLLRKLAAQI